VIVIDCAALVDALSAAPDTAELRAQLADEELHAPSLLDYEVLSAVRGLTLGGHISPARAADVLTDFDDLPVTRWPFADPLRRRAFVLRDAMSAYDAASVVLAEALGCPLVTRDLRLARSTGHGVRIEVA
jgi:predicted nucleic acid-binding protein